jgi:hypothetical protein
MALGGTTFLALWNDVVRVREPEYDRWHTQEHVPERVAVTGFHGARRYVDRAREHHRYFTLYDVADLAVFEHPEYADLVANPTPWSASMRPDFRNFLRAACRVAVSRGDGIGAALAINCYLHADAPSLDLAVATALAHPGVTGCHVGEGSGGAAPAAWTNPPAASIVVRPFDRVMLIEAIDRVSAVGALAAVRRRQGLVGLPADFGGDVYDLAFVFPGHDPAERMRHRRAGWNR